MDIVEGNSLKIDYGITFREHFQLKKTLKRAIKSCLPKSTWEKLQSWYNTVNNIIRPRKGARVYIRRGIGRMDFFHTLNERNIEYVLLRWWQDLPEMPDGEDMDILIKDEHRDLINDLLTFRDYGTDLICDIYTVAGSKYGSHREIPYFQNNLALTLINTRILYKGVYVPSSIPYFASLAYHAIFHKGEGSGLSGFETKQINLEHNYSSILANEALKSNINVDISVQGLFGWLKGKNFNPAEDTLSKLVEIKPELSFLQKALFSDARGGDVIVYIIRQRLLEDKLIADFVRCLKDKFKLDVIDIHELDSSEIEICSSQIRGGKWDNGPYKNSGGPPGAFVIVFDENPWPLDDLLLQKQPRTTNNNNLNAKYSFRNQLSKLVPKENYNGIHSADNEQDAWDYISLLGKEYKDYIFSEVERRRNGSYESKFEPNLNVYD